MSFKPRFTSFEATTASGGIAASTCVENQGTEYGTVGLSFGWSGGVTDIRTVGLDPGSNYCITELITTSDTEELVCVQMVDSGNEVGTWCQTFDVSTGDVVESSEPSYTPWVPKWLIYGGVGVAALVYLRSRR